MANNSKNLAHKRSEYNCYYDGFRGVDFSTDHTRIPSVRFAYLANMWRDYHSEQGGAVSTVPGYRRVWKTAEQTSGSEESDRIWGVHKFTRRDADGKLTDHILVHSGKKIYEWEDLNRSTNIVEEMTVVLGEPESTTGTVKSYSVSLANINITDLIAAYDSKGRKILDATLLNSELRLSSSSLATGESVRIEYYDTLQSRTKGTFMFTADRAFSYINPLVIDLSIYGVKKISDCRLNTDIYASSLLWSFKNGKLSISPVSFTDSIESGVLIIIKSWSKLIFDDAAERSSVTFTWDNKMYYLDGKNYLRYDGIDFEEVTNNAYIPITYSGIIPAGENADTGVEKEQRNYLSDYVIEEFIADGTTKEFPLVEKADSVVSVKVYDENVDFSINKNTQTVILDQVPVKPEDKSLPAGTSGVKIMLKVPSVVSDILGCTIAAVYDDRVFFSGNPKLPNHIFWSALNDPTYFGILNFVQDGVGNAPITALLPVSDTLMALKSDTVQDGSVYYHTAQSTDSDLQPKIYPSQRGLAGIGCIGPCINFFDDPVFLSRLGIEAIGQLSVRLERAIEHRSALIDAKLTACDLSKATLAEWDGYLLLLCEGKIFMADSRQRFTDDMGVVQYEWYYMEDVGVWDGQYLEYKYSDSLSESLKDAYVKYCPECHCNSSYCTGGHANKHRLIRLSEAKEVYDPVYREFSDLRGETVNPPDEDGNESSGVLKGVVYNSDGTENTEIELPISYTVAEDAAGELQAYLCYEPGSYIGGVFHPAVKLVSVGESLFFGTDNGVICRFNTDKRDEYGEIPARYYNFDGRTIRCGCATKMDNCGIPHLTKTTIKRSLVVKMKAMQRSAVKLKVRTNRSPYQQIARLNSAVFDLNDIDFSDFTFVTQDDHLFSVNEKEKKWIEKQFFLYSDEYCKPFSLYYLAYRYKVAGRFKE